MKAKTLSSSLLLLLAALIWGSTFVAQSVGMEHIGPLTFVCVRSFIGSAALIPVLAVMQKTSIRQGNTEGILPRTKRERGRAILGGTVCGVFLMFGMVLQQYGMLHLNMTGGNVGKAGFITTMYILLVPIFGLFFRQKVSPKLWVSVGLAIIALYLLSVSEGFSIAVGDISLILCAFAFAAQILAADYFVKETSGVLLSCIQFLFCALVTLIPAIFMESPEVTSILGAWQSILYAGIMSSGVAFTLQIVAQKDLHPTLASLLMSCESVFAVLSGFLILGQAPTSRELIGSVIMFIAVILAQLPPLKKKK
ncbi:MAG: DMT family transporter [Ruminococcaceae bacterium]|nr:DMT family transporter [Oscillospiraceae bacterium]